MKQQIIIAVIAVGCFLLGTLMPHSPRIDPNQGEDKVTVRVDTMIQKLVETVLLPPEKPDTEYVYVKPDTPDTVRIRDTVYLALPRQYYYSEAEGVKIWHSGVESRIDSLVTFMETRFVPTEVWKKHNLYFGANAGYYGGFRASLGVEYQYNIFKWLSISGNTGYDFYLKQPYIMAGAKFRINSW